MRLGDIPVGLDAPPFLVAELSANHGQSLERALAVVEAAATAGAHAIKFQTYRPEAMTLNRRGGLFTVEQPGGPWDGYSLFGLYSEGVLPWEWHAALFQRARDLGLVPFSSPFDLSAVEFLEGLGCPVYKIASFEVTNHPLIQAVGSTGKPMIMSTGMATVSEIADGISVYREAGGSDYALLKCTSSYPAPVAESNLVTIPHMRELFDCEVGLSDHTPGIGAAVAAVALGATIIEKHLTLSRSAGGVDAAFSAEPDELRRLAEELDRARLAKGRVKYGPVESEKLARQYRRSIYVARDMAAGDFFTTDNIRCIRPGAGLHPSDYERILGKRVARDVEAGTPLDWNLVE